MLLDQVERPVGVEAGLDQRGAALEQGREQHLVQGGRVEQRRGHQGDLVVADVDVDEQVEDVPHDVAVGELHALGAPAGARRVLDHEQLVVADGQVQRGRVVRQHRVQPPAGVGLDGQLRQAERAHVGRADDGLEARVPYQEPGLAVGEDPRRLRRGQAGVQRQEDRPELGRGEHGDDELDGVQPEEGHPLPALDPAVAQRVRQPGGPLLELRVGRGDAVLDVGRLVRGHPGAAGRPRAQSLVLHAVSSSVRVSPARGLP
ncbi:hypothetical protein [Blastococcus sp. TF02A_35]|uniref:hypothetical protein n=1 Tax=Blastococcus sp. TF02A-35 TaxID=2559612 RepID=UPI00247462AB|nr:hypothetical protein [Blastococcus sp. TF02A_35]